MRLSLSPSNSPVLRTKAKKVADPSRLGSLVDDLIETMIAESGVGLAAPQLGKSVRVFVTGIDKHYNAFINPEIIAVSEEQIWWEEGCLSLPRMLGEVKRPKQVTVRALDRHGKQITISADNLTARVLQHEHDHLEGILFPDRMSDLATLKKLTEEEWQTRLGEREKRPGDKKD